MGIFFFGRYEEIELSTYLPTIKGITSVLIDYP